MNHRKILITGSNGFIGKQLMRWIKKKFPEAILYGTVRRAPVDEGQEIINLMDPDQVKTLINRIQPNYIFHLAGVIYAKSWDDFYDGNVKTTLNILEAVKDNNNTTKVIVLGSAAEYGNVQMTELPLTEDKIANPMSFYGISKSYQTLSARYYSQLGVPVTIARLFNAYGFGISDQLSIGAFLSQISKIAREEVLPQLITGNLSAKRDFLYIDDVCSGLICLAKRGISGEAYNICSGKSMSMEWIVEKMLEATGLKVEILKDPKKFKAIDVPDIYGSYQKIHELNGWSPSISLEDGISYMMRKETK